MYLNYLSEYKGEIKTLTFKRNPLHHGLGYYADTDGNLWDVTMVVGSEKPYVCARPVDNSPYYSTDVTSHSYGSHKWLPYYFKVVK